MSDKSRNQAHGLPRDLWTRWQMDSFHTPSAAPVPESQPDTEARLQELEQQAQARGHETGYAQGHAEGLKSGTAKGSEQGHLSGYAQGHAEGYEAGYAEGQSKANDEARALQALADSFTASLSTIEDSLGQAMVALAIGIAEQVVRDAISTRPESLLPLVREIIQLHGDSETALVIHAHPDDHALLQSHLEADTGLRRWRLVPDAAIERGGCAVQTALGAIDATLATRWRRAVAALGHPPVLPA